MEKNLTFNSQVATSKSQSERLLALGLKKETADMWWMGVVKDSKGKDIPKRNQHWWLSITDSAQVCGLMQIERIPAWSLHRLLSILNESNCIVDITVIDGRYGIHCGYDTEWYDDLYEGIIAAFDTLIKERYFNKKYLV